MSNEGTLLQDLEKLRALAKPTISKEEAETCQKWAGMDGATAFHLIERHAANWADTRLMMDAWLQANLSARAEELPPDVLDWAQKIVGLNLHSEPTQRVAQFLLDMNNYESKEK